MLDCNLRWDFRRRRRSAMEEDITGTNTTLELKCKLTALDNAKQMTKLKQIVGLRSRLRHLSMHRYFFALRSSPSSLYALYIKTHYTRLIRFTGIDWGPVTDGLLSWNRSSLMRKFPTIASDPQLTKRTAGSSLRKRQRPNRTLSAREFHHPGRFQLRDGYLQHR